MNRLTAGLACLSLVLIVGAGVAGCPKDAPPELLTDAYQLGLQYRWTQAQPLVKQYLLARPEDPSAHFLLGRSYLHQSQPHFLPAEGEFHLAMELYAKTGQVGGLAGHLSGNTFQAAIYRELARLEMRRLYEAARAGFPASRQTEHAAHALVYVRKGLTFDPGAEVLREMEKTLQEYTKPSSTPAPPPSIRRQWII